MNLESYVFIVDDIQYWSFDAAVGHAERVGIDEFSYRKSCSGSVLSVGKIKTTDEDPSAKCNLDTLRSFY